MAGHNSRSRDKKNRSARPQSSMKVVHKQAAAKHSEEYAAELTAPFGAPVQAPVELVEVGSRRDAAREKEESQEQSRWLGYSALTLGVLSLFMFPALFGGAAAVLGFFSYNQGRKAMGVWSIALGLVSMASYFLLAPAYS
ncbi:hypothetical protein N0M98_25395 [Paenibacillus doosanensis]|uniref:DUF4190 domain-containing protein n=1 Tax=Paenibacillus konkukensis TaxID=2020716 RepID=A0ABY4RXS8_9BACL|nr:MULTISPECIES: hypothetical protein [Paenibacillus]MCS7463446.1 hypothetical protein [Paenibacillus doosanensis]UQZ87018.1 hypothetical protein SK3146_06311 [Paenibacillus konkukensis]